MTEHRPEKIDLRDVITDRPPPIMPPGMDAPPVPDLTPPPPKVRMKTFSHVRAWTPPPPPRREVEPRPPVALEEIEWLLEGSLAPSDDREVWPKPRRSTLAWWLALSLSVGTVAAVAMWLATG